MRAGTEINGRYLLISRPLRGGTGEVWVAEDLMLGRRVALKRALPGDGAMSSGRLRAEARALARFSHPHVVVLYDTVHVASAAGDTCWMVMEYVPGGSLDRRPPIPPRDVAHIGAQIADALGALHAAGIVHCDVKPGNIVVTDEGTAKLADFGAAYRVPGSDTLTPRGPISHTPAYAAPEVLDGRPEPASDTFSLGAALCALVLGGPPRRPAAGGPVDIPAGTGPLRGLLVAMLRQEPHRRPGIADVQRTLQHLAHQTADDADPLPADSPVPPDTRSDPQPSGDVRSGHERRDRRQRLRSWSQRHRRTVTVVTVAVLMITLTALSGSAWDRLRHRTQRPAAASSIIAEPRTADPCALADPAALGRFGTAELVDDYGNFDQCDVMLTSRPAGLVDVKVDLNRAPAPESGGPARQIGRIRLHSQRPDGRMCRRTLLLPSSDPDTYVLILVQQLGRAVAPLCAIADTAAASAIAVLNRGPLARRPPPPARSLAMHNPCTLLSPRALNAVPGIDAGHQDIGFGSWYCRWRSTTEDLQVVFRFDRGEPLTASDGAIVQLDRHQAFVEPDGNGPKSCLTRVVYRTYIDRNGREAIEMLHLTVKGARPTTWLCTTATDLARAATTALPP
ncbi:serine/threonine-protein kinase [Actinomadura fibrosa]|uniref:non-specific serine/threonine protein kinase n=1 Tax=Actinomadura fibrosa TaxID=111802 RepID=A0ABW2XTF4_9ACTN|nr:serine/threonine-protein kinase [Actinomadura fibrosa]